MIKTIMAYSKWRNTNINTLERQQMLEAIEAFKTYTKENDLNGKINPTIGKKCLQAVGRLREAHKNKQCITISEIISLKREMSDIIVSDLFEEKSQTVKVERIVEDVDQEGNRSDDDTSETHSKSSQDVDSDTEKMMKMFSSGNEGNEIFKNIGAMTGSLLSSFMNPMINNAVDIAKPQANIMASKLKIMKDDPEYTIKQRQLYKTAYKYYNELEHVYEKNSTPMEKAMASDEISKKYKSILIEEALSDDPNIGELFEKTKTVAPVQLNQDFMKGIDQLENIDKQCMIS